MDRKTPYWQFLFLAGIGLLGAGGCSPLTPRLGPNVTLSPSTDLETGWAFQRALQAEAGSPALERARIEYLLERVAKSPYNFIRNGSRYTGRRAGSHLRWKYFFRNRSQVKTAEDFINRVATRSKRTAQPYLVEFPDQHRYPLGPLLLNELRSFDKALGEQRKRIAEVREIVSPPPNP